MKMVTRAQWGARSPKYVNRGTMREPSTGHWNGPKVPVASHDRCASLVRGIQNFHMDGRGWADIAYNFIVCPHEYVFEGRGINVFNGANGTNMANRSSHAIMWLAGQGNAFPEIEKIAFKEAVHYISSQSSAPNRAVGHRDHKSTECPGNERYNWIRSGMPVAVTPTPAPTPTKKGKKMFSFLFRTVKSPAVWLVSGDMMTKQWVRSPAELAGFKAILKLNGGNDGVCALPEADPMSLAVAQIPAVGAVPQGYNGPKA